MRRAPMQTKKSFCRFCHANCAIEVDIEDGHIVAYRVNMLITFVLDE